MVDPLLGSIIGNRYRLIQVVGQGGMGVVYRAEDVRLADRPCAVKLLMGTSMDPDEAQRFERELTIIARLRSPHVVQVLDTGVLPDNRRFIVMELLEGLSLSGLLKQCGHLDPRRAVRLIKGVLAGLSEAHEWGIVHRDLKPANVFVTQARTGEEIGKVLDFGIAKDTHSIDSDLTNASMLIGTPKYMAPEQFLKQGASTRTDLYAVGLLFYQVLCGRPPFLAQDPVADNIKMMPDEFRVGWLHVHQQAAPLDIDPALWRIIEKLLAKQPADRFADADEVIAAFAHWEGLPITPELPTVMDDPAVSPSQVSSTTGFPVMGESVSGMTAIAIKPPRRTGLWAVLAGVVLVVGGAAAWWATQDGQTPQAPVSAAAPKASECVHYVVTTPPGAIIKMGPDTLGMTPVEIKRPCAEQWLLSVSADGHQSQQLTLKGKRPRAESRLTLKSLSPASVASEAPKPAVPVSAAKKKKTPRKRMAPRRKVPARAKKAPARVKKAAPATQAAPATKAASTPTLPF